MSLVTFVCSYGATHSPYGMENFNDFLEKKGITKVETAYVGLEPLMDKKKVPENYYKPLSEATLVVNCSDRILDKYIRDVNEESPILYYPVNTHHLDEEGELFDTILAKLEERKGPLP